MMVKQWNNRIKNINSYLPWMKPNVRAFTEEDLINKVITPNIPLVWEKDFRLANSHLKHPESIDIPRATQLAAPLLAAAAIAKQEAQTVMFMNNS
jgi:hypothetical protein